MSLLEALDKGCVPLLGTARFLFCGSRFLRAPVRSTSALRTRGLFGLPHLCHSGPFARLFAFPLGARFPPLHPFAKIKVN